MNILAEAGREATESGSTGGASSSAPGLDPVSRELAIALGDWLLREGGRLDQGMLLGAFAERLLAIGVPVERMTTAIEALHPEYSGVGRFWTREQGGSLRYFPHGDKADAIYRASPFHEAHRIGEWLVLDLAATPLDRFEIIPELVNGGYRHYLCVPIRFADGTANGLSLATRDPAGFDARSMALLRFVMPAFATVMELRALVRRIDSVLRIYVGDEPQRAILSGTIRRGQVSRISSAILFADMRGFTRMSSRLGPEKIVELLNVYFDCLVPAIEREGGEVLKYLGDGLLAIFRDQPGAAGSERQAALDAAMAALERVERANGTGEVSGLIQVGIALHHGEAAYGNVGAGARLDFTVVGRDVNFASRLARLNKRLGEPLVLSEAFAAGLAGGAEPLGRHQVDGFDEAAAIFRPPPRRA